MNNDEGEVEEVVFVELTGLIDQEWSHAAGQMCKIIGIDCDEPILQLGRNVFSGAYEDTLGTKVLFECNSKAAADGSQSDGSVLDYALCVDKVLHMQRVFLTERDDGAGRQPSGTSSASVPAGDLEDKDACMTDTAVSSEPAAESDEVTSHIDAGDDDVLCVKPR